MKNELWKKWAKEGGGDFYLLRFVVIIYTIYMLFFLIGFNLQGGDIISVTNRYMIQLKNADTETLKDAFCPDGATAYEAARYEQLWRKVDGVKDADLCVHLHDPGIWGEIEFDDHELEYHVLYYDNWQGEVPDDFPEMLETMRILLWKHFILHWIIRVVIWIALLYLFFSLKRKGELYDFLEPYSKGFAVVQCVFYFFMTYLSAEIYLLDLDRLSEFHPIMLVGVIGMNALEVAAGIAMVYFVFHYWRLNDLKINMQVRLLKDFLLLNTIMLPFFWERSASASFGYPDREDVLLLLGCYMVEAIILCGCVFVRRRQMDRAERHVLGK